MTDHIVPFAPKKIEQIREAGRKALSPAEFSMLEALLDQLSFRGMTPYINTELGRLMAKFGWTLEVTEAEESDQALVACDGAFLLEDLKRLCRANNLSPSGDKKTLCGRLFKAQVEDVVEVMLPVIEAHSEAVLYLREKGEKRYTTVHDRYEIGCSVCGSVAHAMTLSDALAQARTYRKDVHKSPEEVVTVFDVMARRGACSEWNLEGRCIGYKEK